MGGIGSGRWCRPPGAPAERKALVNELPAYHVGDLTRAGVLDEGAAGWLPPCRGNGADPGFIEFSYRSGQLRLTFEADGPYRGAEAVVEVLCTPCHFGGFRSWFACPDDSCGRRVGVLYLKDGRLRCRSCQDLGYPSQHRPKLQRLHDKAQGLRAKLGRWSDFSEKFPPRPKGMHLVTYNTLLMEIVQTEAQIVELRRQKIDQIMSRAFGYQWSPAVSLHDHWQHVLGE